MGLAERIFRCADELRAVATAGLAWSDGKPHDAQRYRHVLSVAADLASLVDPRTPEVIEKTLFTTLTHLAPVPVGDAAVFNNHDQILLIRRADDGLWAMPGGGFEMGETPAQGAQRETLEEAGARVEVTDLIGVYDSRLCGTHSPIHLYMFVFHCRLREQHPEWVTTPDEVLDVGWFNRESLPNLSPGHTIRVPDAISFHHRPDRPDRSALFDSP